MAGGYRVVPYSKKAISFIRYSIIFGGGVSLPHVEGKRNDFFSQNGNRVGYDLMTCLLYTSEGDVIEIGYAGIL